MSELAAIMARRRKMEEGGEAPSLQAESPKAATGSSGPGAGGGSGAGGIDNQLQSAMARRRTMEESGNAPSVSAGRGGGAAASGGTSTAASSSGTTRTSGAKKGSSSNNNKRPPRLYVEGAILGYKRGQRNQYEHVSLVKIKNVDCKADAEFYCGKKIAFVTKAPGNKKKSKAKAKEFRVQWGKVCRPHGSNGVVRCRFKRNLPPQAMGGRVRIMLYPSNL